MTKENRKPSRRRALKLIGLGCAAAGASACAGAGNAMPTPEGKTPLTADRMIGKTLRVVRPGEFVTQEFNPQRVTVNLDETGAIKAVRIG